MYSPTVLKKDLHIEVEEILQNIFKEDYPNVVVKPTVTLQVFLKDVYVYDFDDLCKAYYARLFEKQTNWKDYKDFIKGYETNFLGY